METVEVVAGKTYTWTMKKILMASALVGILVLSGCGMTAPTDAEGIKKLREFKVACEESGGQLDMDTNGIYRCYMYSQESE